MSVLLEATIIVSFWTSLVMAWKITLYETHLSHAPDWWVKAREKAWGGILYVVCAFGVVIPLVALFFPIQ